MEFAVAFYMLSVLFLTIAIYFILEEEFEAIFPLLIALVFLIGGFLCHYKSMYEQLKREFKCNHKEEKQSEYIIKAHQNGYTITDAQGQSTFVDTNNLENFIEKDNL